MQNWKFYIAVAGVGALSDLGLNAYLSNTEPTGEMTKGLKSFYSQVNPVKSMFWAGATFVSVTFIADFIFSKLIKKK